MLFRSYGVMILLFFAVFFWGVFKIITPENFGSTSALVNYFLSSIIYSVGGCGLFFIVVMGMFDFSIGANVILSSIVGVIASTYFNYPKLLIGVSRGDLGPRGGGAPRIEFSFSSW